MNNTRRVLVTGAGRGIGRATAEHFAAEGWKVGAFDLQPCDWTEGDDRYVTGVLDVTRPQDWEQALSEFCGVDGSLDVLVNNAGVLYGSPFVDASYEQDRTLVEVNVTGVLYGCRASFDYLRRAGGRVVNVCSAAAIYGQPEMATYSATKFAVRGITEALEFEWAPHGVAVTAVWPLFVGTAMLEGVETTGMRSLGVRLTEADVADAVYRAAVPGSRPADLVGRVRAGLNGVLGEPVHRPVGLQARAMYAGSQLVPGVITRAVNRALTR